MFGEIKAEFEVHAWMCKYCTIVPITVKQTICTLFSILTLAPQLINNFIASMSFVNAAMWRGVSPDCYRKKIATK